MQPTMQKNNVKQRKTIAIIAMIAVAAIALAAVAIIAVSNKREMTQAASDTCALNAKALATHQESFEEAQQEAEEAAKLTVNDVADGTTLETLKDAITLAKAVESAPACPASGNASDFTKATDDIRKYADNLRNITNELDAAAKSVVASQEHSDSSPPSKSGKPPRRLAPTSAPNPTFNGAKVIQVCNFAPITSIFAPHRAYIWQIRQVARRHFAYIWQVIPERPQLEGTKLPPN